MLNKLRITLAAGCISAGVLCCLMCPGVVGESFVGVTVQAASLEDSMLKPSSESQNDKKDSDSTQEASAFVRTTDTITQAADLVDLAQEDRIQEIGKMCAQDSVQSGVLASVSAAQCILESGYLTTELATEANNCFGMKATLSGNDWEGSAWDGESTYTKQTGEEYGGQNVTIVADFRRYDSVEDSVADHSAYLLGATVDGGTLRYAGLKGETDYRQAITIIKNGGYATDSSYIDKICSIIERYDLTRFDTMAEELGTEEADSTKNKSDDTSVADKTKKSEKSTGDQLYRVRKSWEDVSSQLGAFTSLERAKAACKTGYKVFDSQGNEVE